MSKPRYYSKFWTWLIINYSVSEQLGPASGWTPTLIKWTWSFSLLFLPDHDFPCFLAANLLFRFWAKKRGRAHHADYIMWNAVVDESQAEVKIAKRNINSLRYACDATIMAQSEEEVKSLLVRVEKGVKSWLKTQLSTKEDHGVWSHHFMANRGGNSGNIDRFFFVCLFVFGGGGAPKSMQAVTAAMKLRHLLFGIKAMINLDSILKSRDITFPVKICLVKAMISPVILYRCESDYKEGWVPKNWGFQIVVLEKTLENPLDSKQTKPINPKGNQPWVFIGRTDAETESLILWPSDSKRANLLERVGAGKIEGRKRRGWQRMRWLDGITDSVDMNISELWEIMKNKEARPGAVQGVTKTGTLATKQQSSHIDTIKEKKILLVMRTFRIYSLNNFLIYNRVVLTTVIILYIKTLILIYLITKTPFWQKHANNLSTCYV